MEYCGGEGLLFWLTQWKKFTYLSSTDKLLKQASINYWLVYVIFVRLLLYAILYSCTDRIEYDVIFDKIYLCWYFDSIVGMTLYFHKILTQWDFWLVIINNVDIMTKSVKANIK